MVAFLIASRAGGRRKVLGPRAMAPLMSYLREAGAACQLTQLSSV